MSRSSDSLRDQSYSVVIPVHNEARLLKQSMPQILGELDRIGRPFEIVLCENGSHDETLKLARELERAHASVRVVADGVADYGAALKRGIAASRHALVVIVNIDFWSSTFVRRALEELGSHEFVIGSKRMPGSVDERPWVRRAITFGFNGFLRVFWGFRGSDTHGLKAFKRDTIQPVVNLCVTNGWIFDTELVLLAERRDLKILEIPVRLGEIRAPSYGLLLARIPRTVKNLVRMRANLLRHAQDDRHA